MQDGEAGVTVATPDAPLWQIGGYTFGRFPEEKAAPYHATLNAWLTNNYWYTNLMADQADELHFEFTPKLLAAEDPSDRADRALKHVNQPEIQPFVARVNPEMIARLPDFDLDGLRLVGARFDEVKRVLTLILLNPTAERRMVRMASGHLKVRRVSLITRVGEATAISDTESFGGQIEGCWWGQGEGR